MTNDSLQIPDQIAGNPSVNTAIHRAFRAIGSQRVVDQFLKKFRVGRGNNLALLHAYRELIFGEWAANQGFSPEYEARVDGRTPDWLLRRNGCETILEVTTLHTHKEQLEQIEAAALGDWIFGAIDPDAVTKRCLNKITEKCQRYSSMASARPLLIGLHLDFDLGISPIDLLRGLEPAGIWKLSPLDGLVIQQGEKPYAFTVRLRPGSGCPRFVSPPDTHPLRHAILRPNQPISACTYPNDDAPDSLHLGIRGTDDTLIAVASFYREPLPDSDDLNHASPALRIRGMAVLPAHRNQGLGRALVEAGIAAARDQSPPPALVWCNARTSAAGYYAKLGFTPHGDEFEIEGIGPHFVMTKPIA